MKKLFSVLLLTPFFCFSQANLLNTKSSFEIKKVSKQVDEDAKPLDYEYVSDDDILFSFTTWEVIDLNQRVNFPLYFPTEISLVSLKSESALLRISEAWNANLVILSENTTFVSIVVLWLFPLVFYDRGENKGDKR